MAFTSRRASQRALMTVTGGLRIPQLLGFLVVVVVVVVTGPDAARACPFTGLRSRVTACAVLVVVAVVVVVVVVVVIDEELRGNVV